VCRLRCDWPDLQLRVRPSHQPRQTGGHSGSTPLHRCTFESATNPDSWRAASLCPCARRIERMGVTTWMNYLEANRDDTKPLIAKMTRCRRILGLSQSVQLGWILASQRQEIVGSACLRESNCTHASRFNAQGPTLGSTARVRLVRHIQLGDILTLPL